MRRSTRLLCAALICSGLAACASDTGNADPKETDAGDDDASTDAGVDLGPPERALVDHRPLAGITTNRLEDPNLLMRSDSWFGADDRGARHRLGRIFAVGTPEGRPAAAVTPRGDAALPVCALGRLLWGAGMHEVNVWLAGDLQNASASVIGVSLSDNVLFVRARLSPTPDEFEGAGRTWTRYQAGVTPFYGWGFLEVCAGSPEGVVMGAPSVEETPPSPTSLVAPTRWEPTWDATARIDAFEVWRRERVDARRLR